jgi:molybdopterin synthase sulfur carrier subunit
MISVNIKFFGPLRDIVQRDQLTVNAPEGWTGDDLFRKLSVDYPDLRKWKQSVRLAVNLEYVQFSSELKSGDEISFIPPVSGG